MFNNLKQTIVKALTRDSITVMPTLDLPAQQVSEDSLELALQKGSYDTSLYLQKGLLIIKDAICSVDFEVYKLINSKGEAERIEDHEILKLLDNPNPMQTRGEFLRVTAVNFKLSGEAFWRIIFNSDLALGTPTALINMNPSDVDVVINEAGELEYRVNQNNKQIILPANQVVHMKDPNPKNPLRGEGVLKTVLTRIQAELQSVEYMNGQFLRNGNPDGLLIYKQAVSDQEEANKLKRQFLNSFKGINDKNRTAVVFGDATHQQLNNNANALDYISAQKQIRNDIITALGVPQSLVTSEDVNRANADAGLEQFMRFTLVPMIRLMLESINERLIIPYYGEDLYLGTQKLVSENKDEMIKEITLTSQGRRQIISVNEARQRLGYEPVDDPSADNLEVGSAYPNMSDLVTIQNAFIGRRSLHKRFKLEERYLGLAKKEALVKTLKSPTFKSMYKRAYNSNQDKAEGLIKGTMRSYLHAQRDRVIANLEDGADTTSKLLDTKTERAIMTETITPIFEKIARQAGNLALSPIKAFKPEIKYSGSPKVSKTLAKRIRFISGSINDTTWEAIHNIVVDKMSEGIPAVKQAIIEKYDQIDSGRANTIARTESCYITSMATQNAFEESPVVAGKQWLTANDNNVRNGDAPDNHVINESRVVDKDADFPNGESFPGEATINCRCALAPVVDINNL